MSKSIKISANTSLQNFGKPYVIAELGSNHNGDMKLARELILKAKQAGADCVKFQSWSKETVFAKVVYDENSFLADDYTSRDDYTLEQIVEEYSISEEELLEMKSYADEIGITCTSTPFSKKEVDFLVEKLQAPFIKVASMDLNNYPFLKYIASKNLPMIISTGLSDLHEIDRAIQVIEGEGNDQITILHCISIYPPKDDLVNLRVIKSLQEIYPYPIGFSDHTLGIEIPLASVAFGAALIEKHFTLDKEMPGWDHKVSADFEDMKALTSGAKKVASALGSGRITSVEDAKRKEEFRRSIVVTRGMKAGEQITNADLDFKRPGRGISPADYDYVIGRTLKSDLGSDEVLFWSHLV